MSPKPYSHEQVLHKLKVERLQVSIRSLEDCPSPDGRIDECLQEMYHQMKQLRADPLYVDDVPGVYTHSTGSTT